MRIVDYLKNRQLTPVLTSVSDPGGEDTALSSLIDNFVQLRVLQHGPEQRRCLYIQGFALTNDGIVILDASPGAAV